MASDLTVQTIRGPGSGANANQILIPSGHKVVAPAGGLVAPGQIIQVVTAHPTYNASITSTSWVSTDLYINITPKYANSKIIINGHSHIGYYNGGNHLCWRLHRNGTDITNAGYGLGNTYGDSNSSQWIENSISFHWDDTPNTIAQTEYRIYVRRENSTATGSSFGGYSARAPYIQAIEVAQ